MTKFSLNQIIICRDFAVNGPMVKPVGLLAKDVLDSGVFGVAISNFKINLFDASRIIS